MKSRYTSAEHKSSGCRLILSMDKFLKQIVTGMYVQLYVRTCVQFEEDINENGVKKCKQWEKETKGLVYPPKYMRFGVCSECDY